MWTLIEISRIILWSIATIVQWEAGEWSPRIMSNPYNVFQTPQATSSVCGGVRACVRTSGVFQLLITSDTYCYLVQLGYRTFQ